MNSILEISDEEDVIHDFSPAFERETSNDYCGRTIMSGYLAPSGSGTNGSSTRRTSPPYSESPSPQRGSYQSTSDSFREPVGTKLPDFADTDFYINPKVVEMGPIIGEGAFSTVYAARYFGDIVAVKKQTRKGKDLEKYLLRELQVLKYIRHENMLEYIGAYNVIAKTRGQLHAVFIVTEYAAGGDLLKLLLRHEHELGWKFRIRIAKEGLEALEYLHYQDLIHRDIKSSNFLLDSNYKCKLSDFGMAREVCKDGRMTICGTDEYMAPEMLFDEFFSHPADMYSFGMVLLELVTRCKIGEVRKVTKDGNETENRFAKRHPKNLFKLDEAEIQASIGKDAPQSLVTLMLQCLASETESRPTAEEGRAWLEDLLNDIDNDTCPVPPLPVVEGMFEAEEEKETLSEALASLSRIPNASGLANLPNNVNSLTYSTSESLPPLHKKAEMYMQMPSLVESGVNISTISGGSNPPPVRENIPSKMGYLHVKNQGIGFRNWKRRWFVLKGSELICYKDGGHILNVDLRGCTLVRGKTNRFQVVKLGKEDRTHNLVGLEEMELAAPNAAGLEAWLSMLQGGIDYANGQGDLSNDGPLSIPSPTSQAEGLTIQEWLKNMNMEDLIPAFLAKGYKDMEKINSRGLSNEDMDKIGIKNPLRRRYLDSLGRSPFRKNLQVTVVGHRSFGEVVVFKVVTEWRAWYSKTEKLFTDFNKLHNKLRRALKDDQSPLLQNLPDLPGKGKVVQNQKDPAFILNRKKQLQGYMQELVQLVGFQEPYFTIICDALDLLPSPPEPVALT